MKKESWIKSTWMVSIGTAIFSLLLTIGYDYLKEKPVLTTVFWFFKLIGDSLGKILNYDLKVWWILTAAVFLFLALLIVGIFEKDKQIAPEFFSYKEDKFKNWKWSWTWEWNDLRKAWSASNMKAHCPKCDTGMIDNSNSYSLLYTCPRCEFTARDAQCDEPYKVEGVILDNIERKRKEHIEDS